MKRWSMGRFWVIFFAVILAGAAGSLATSAERSQPLVVSRGLEVLAARTDLALSTVRGNDLVFSQDAVAKGMNLSQVQYLTVSTLPSVTEGELLLGSSRVAAGQVLSGAQLDHLSFHPASENVSNASFRFAVNGSGCVMTCRIRVLEEPDRAPTVAAVPVLSLKKQTYRDIAVHGTLSAHDPDGDAICFEVVTYPKNGSVELTDPARGSYVYRPYADYIGSDSFRYVARDQNGNYSAAVTVSLSVEQLGTSVSYTDMVGRAEESDALRLTENGVMSGQQVGDRYYFYPEQTVSRADFLVMAMHAAGITDVPDQDRTVFADDSEIPAGMKGYVAAAYRLGYITGSLREGQLCFLPDEELTRAQAAVILDRITEPGKPAVVPTFSDRSDIPVWAADAIDSLHAVGILLPSNGQIAPARTVTRAEAAQMLAALLQYRKS